MSINTNPTQKSPQRAFSLQKYLLLHSQQYALQKHIDDIFSTYSKSQSSKSRLPLQRKRSQSTTLPPNPYTHTHLKTRRNSQSHGGNHSRPSSSLSSTSSSSSSTSSDAPIPEHEKRRSSLSSNSTTTSTSPSRSPKSPTLTSFPDPSTLQQLSVEQSKLKDVNLQIKTTLTELLNSEGVMGDPRFRGWVQSRLMDVERGLRNGRSWTIGMESV